MQQINAIREKAAEAEAIVKTITSDIQRLDVAKQNLTRTMQTLERWSMLQQAHTQLKELIPTNRYKDMASSLSAVVQLLEPLKPLTTISEVAKVFRAAESDRKTVQEKVNGELETLWVLWIGTSDMAALSMTRITHQICGLWLNRVWLSRFLAVTTASTSSNATFNYSWSSTGVSSAVQTRQGSWTTSLGDTHGSVVY